MQNQSQTCKTVIPTTSKIPCLDLEGPRIEMWRTGLWGLPILGRGTRLVSTGRTHHWSGGCRYAGCH